MKLLRTIRFDPSDTHVFETAAEPDEWAVPGAFAFAHLAAEDVTGKTRQAFANGFLGLASFGRSTFTCVAEAEAQEVGDIEDALARHLVAAYGAPGLDHALAAARDELGFVASLCADALTNTIMTVHRQFDETGEIREEFRSIAAPTGDAPHARIWAVVEDEEDA